MPKVQMLAKGKTNEQKTHSQKFLITRLFLLCGRTCTHVIVRFYLNDIPDITPSFKTITPCSFWLSLWHCVSRQGKDTIQQQMLALSGEGPFHSMRDRNKIRYCCTSCILYSIWNVKVAARTLITFSILRQILRERTMRQCYLFPY